MKTLLQTLFFFLLVTQICFAQLYQQKSRMNINNKNGLNLEARLIHDFLTPNFQEKFFSTIGTPDLNDRFNPKALKQNNPQNHRMFSPQALSYVIDTAIVYRLGNEYDSTDFGDTTRHLYSFNASYLKTLDLTQKLVGDLWVDINRETIIFDANNDLLSYTYEYMTNSQWVISYRYTFSYDLQRRIITQSWEGWSNGQLESGQMTTYTYDVNGNTLSLLYQGWANGKWQNNYRETYTYDSDGNNLSFLHEDWFSGQWENNTRVTNTFDESANLLASLNEKWLNGQWKKENQTTYTYDASGKKLYEFGENWYDGQITYRDRISYSYDAEGREIVVLCESSWYSEQLSFSWRKSYTYDAEGRLTSDTFEYIDTNGGGFGAYRSKYIYDANGNQTSWGMEYLISGQWELVSRGISTYDSMGNLLSYAWESLYNGQLSQGYRDTYEYDDVNREISHVYEYFTYGTWENIERWAYGYDSQGNMNSIWHYRWNDSSWTISDYPDYGKHPSPGPGPITVFDSVGNSYAYSGFYNITLKYRQMVTGIVSGNGNVPMIYSLSQNYPNPFNPSTKIIFTIPLLGGDERGGLVTLKVYDILGREVATLVNEYRHAGKYETEFNAATLPSGVYFYQLNTGEYTAVKKMLLLK